MLDVLAQTVQESHVQHLPVFAYVVVKTELLVFLASFSSAMTLLTISVELQTSLALVFCITVKSFSPASSKDGAYRLHS